FLVHTAPGVRKVGDKYEPVCIGTTTSARMVRFTEPLGAQYGVRAICGKGGFPDEAIEPMRDHGMVYFAIVGGAAALETTQIEESEEVAWEELMPECLWNFRVKDIRPRTVSVGARGHSLSDAVYEPAPLDEFKSWLVEPRFSHVEISDGSLDIPRDRKLELIVDFARDFRVLSEVGSKDPDIVFAPYQWVQWIKEELEAGA